MEYLNYASFFAAGISFSALLWLWFQDSRELRLYLVNGFFMAFNIWMGLI